MNDGFDIPIGGDLGPLHEAFDRVIQAIDRVGDQITAAFEKANASVAASVAKMTDYQTRTQQAAGATQQMGTAASSAGAKIASFVNFAAAAGTALSGAANGMLVLSRATKAWTGASLAQQLAATVARAGGMRAAFAKIPAAMSAIASNPTLRKVVIGAVAAGTAILAIRTAWRTAGAGARMLQSAAASSFRAVVSGARSAAAAVRSTFAAVSSAPGKLLSAMPGLPMGGMLAGLGGIAGAITLAMGSISKAAEMETLETAFAPLIGGTENAKKRIQELARFAAATPFELPEVAQASRVLEVLTKGALATGEGLRMVGDVAAATQQPFQEIAMWVGRLYDGLQSGRPVGEAMMRLQELGVVSGDVRGRIEQLQKSGAAGPQIWNEAAAALNRFGGSMERQSTTWSGKLSTLRDTLNMVMAEFGKPIIDGLKPFLDMAIVKLESMREKAAAFGNTLKTGLNAVLAAFQTGNIAGLLGSSFQLAMIKSVNVLAAGIQAVVGTFASGMGGVMSSLTESLKNSGIAVTLSSIFNGIGNMLAAKLREAAADLLQSMGRFGAASDLRDTAKADQTRADNYFQIAKAGLGSMDLASGFADIAEIMRKGKEQFVDEFNRAMGTPFIDPSLAEERFKDTWSKISKQMEENAKKAADAQKAMDDRLRNQGGTPTSAAAAFEKIAKVAGPAVTSLGKVGGGGFGSYTPMVAEQKRTNGLLRSIEKHVARPNPKIPVIA